MKVRLILGGVAVTLAVVGFFIFRSAGEHSPSPSTDTEAAVLPQIEIHPKDSVDAFLEFLEAEPFRGLGLVRATTSDHDLMLGWTRRWVSLPAAYRQDVVRRIAEAWGMYYGGRTTVFAVPTGDELARYTPGTGFEVAGRAGR